MVKATSRNPPELNYQLGFFFCVTSNLVSLFLLLHLKMQSTGDCHLRCGQGNHIRFRRASSQSSCCCRIQVAFLCVCLLRTFPTPILFCSFRVTSSFVNEPNEKKKETSCLSSLRTVCLVPYYCQIFPTPLPLQVVIVVVLLLLYFFCYFILRSTTRKFMAFQIVIWRPKGLGTRTSICWMRKKKKEKKNERWWMEFDWVERIRASEKITCIKGSWE